MRCAINSISVAVVLVGTIALWFLTAAVASGPPTDNAKIALRRDIWANAPVMKVDSLVEALDLHEFKFKVDASPDRVIEFDFGPEKGRNRWPYYGWAPISTVDFATVLVGLLKHPTVPDRYILLTGLKTEYMDRTTARMFTENEDILELIVNTDRIAHLTEGTHHWLMTVKVAGERPHRDFYLTIKLVPYDEVQDGKLPPLNDDGI